jgi:hypothetical protein
MMYNKLLTTITIATLALTASAQTAQIPAFPGAEGHGRYTDGGRGGKVIHVTNLNDSGTGSLREAVKGDSKKIIVFDVGGVIPLASDLVIGANTTIAGQTAPEPGITLRYYTVQPSENNVIRFIRIRRGEEKDINDGADAIWQRYKTGILLDHCSFSWSIDEVASFYDNNNFTMQWCTIAESLVHPGHSKGAHGYGGIWGGKLASFHHNLIAHVANRSPRFNGARYDGNYEDNKLYNEYLWKNALQAENVDFRNCVVFNCGNGCYGGPGGGQVNMVNNYYKSGNGGKTTTITKVSVATADNATSTTPYMGMTSRYYISGNQLDGSAKDWAGVTYDNGVKTLNGERYTPDPNHYYAIDNWTEIDGVDCLPIKLTEPAPIGEVTTHTAAKAFDLVLSYAGASLCRDDVDKRYETETRSGKATYKGSATSYEENGVTKTCTPTYGRIDKVSDVEGYTEENFGTGSRPEGFDTDGDGIPDAWETANGLAPYDATDAALKTIDSEREWYSNLEVYLNSLVEDIMKVCQAEGDGAVDEYYPAWQQPTENPDDPEEPQYEIMSYELSKLTNNTDVNTSEVYSFKDGFTISNNNKKGYATGSENGVKYSAGVQYTINLPEGVSISQITFSGYDNYADADSYIDEVAGTQYGATDYVFPKKNDKVYTLATHTIDFSTPLTGSITFTPMGKQVVWVITLTSKKAVNPGPDPDPVTPGNVDGNEVVDSGDVTYLVNHLLGQRPDDFVSEAADMNGDGEVNIADVTALIAKIIKGNDNNNENGDE